MKIHLWCKIIPPCQGLLCLSYAHVCFFLLCWNIRSLLCIFTVWEKRPKFVSGIFKSPKQNVLKCPLSGRMQQGDEMSVCYISIFIFLNSEALQFSKKKSVSSNTDWYISNFRIIALWDPFYSHSISPHFLVETVFWGHKKEETKKEFLQKSCGKMVSCPALLANTMG